MEPPARSLTYSSVPKPGVVQYLLLIQKQYAAVIKVVTYYCTDECTKKNRKEMSTLTNTFSLVLFFGTGTKWCGIAWIHAINLLYLPTP